jgi:hypothetical protein
MEAKVPLIVGASDGIAHMTSMFGVMVSRCDLIGNVVSQAVNRLMLTASAIGKALGIVKEVNAAGGR